MKRDNRLFVSAALLVGFVGAVMTVADQPPKAPANQTDVKNLESENAAVAERARILLERRAASNSKAKQRSPRQRTVRVRGRFSDHQQQAPARYSEQFRGARERQLFEAPLNANHFYGDGGFGYGQYESFRGQTVTDPFIGRNEYLRRLARQQFNADDMAQREQRVLRNQNRATEAGLRQLRAGDYRKAVVAFRLAENLDQGDPACRIHLGHALMALGRYERGGAAVRRALSLQPKLVMIPFDLASHDQSDAAFERHVARMNRTLAAGRHGGDAYFLQGYVAFSRGEYDAAAAAFENAARRGRIDDALSSFLNLVADLDAGPDADSVETADLGVRPAPANSVAPPRNSRSIYSDQRANTQAAIPQDRMQPLRP